TIVTPTKEESAPSTCNAIEWMPPLLRRAGSVGMTNRSNNVEHLQYSPTTHRRLSLRRRRRL
ncbi:MAG TPA: hypothetical protein PKV73_12695, partial [Agriterribacter sp.]|nr:hypothetical protein [Agriterribacter sp.]